jgi:hypothetical protein
MKGDNPIDKLRAELRAHHMATKPIKKPWLSPEKEREMASEKLTTYLDAFLELLGEAQNDLSKEDFETVLQSLEDAIKARREA